MKDLKAQDLNIEVNFNNESWSRTFKSLRVIRLDDVWLTANITINDTFIKYCNFRIDEYHNIQFFSSEYWIIDGVVFDADELLEHVRCSIFFDEFGDVACVEKAGNMIDETFFKNDELTEYGVWFIENEFEKILERIGGMDGWGEYESIVAVFEIKEDEITDDHWEYETLYNKSHYIENICDGIKFDWSSKYPQMLKILEELCVKQAAEWLKET